MNHEGKNPHHVGKEDTPAYRALNAANVLCTEHRRKDVSDIFTGVDRPANTDRVANLKTRSPYFLLGPLGCCAYHCTHTELFVPAGHVGFLMDDKNQYLFAQPGMHNISSAFIRVTASPKPLRGHIRHGNRTIVIVDQGCLAKTRAARGASRSPCSARARSRGRIRASRTRERLIVALLRATRRTTGSPCCSRRASTSGPPSRSSSTCSSREERRVPGPRRGRPRARAGSTTTSSTRAPTRSSPSTRATPR